MKYRTRLEWLGMKVKIEMEEKRLKSQRRPADFIIIRLDNSLDNQTGAGI